MSDHGDSWNELCLFAEKQDGRRVQFADGQNENSGASTPVLFSPCFHQEKQKLLFRRKYGSNNTKQFPYHFDNSENIFPFYFSSLGDVTQRLHLIQRSPGDLTCRIS